MEEKNSIKVSISNVLLIISIIIIIILALFIYKINDEKNDEKKKNTELQAKTYELNEQIDILKSTISELQEKIDKVSETINSNSSNKDSDNKNVTFTDEKIKNSFQQYLDLISYREGSPSGLLMELKLISKESNDNAKKEGYLKTNVEYSTFKEAILNYVTEKCYNNDKNGINANNSFINEDGFLCYLNGGATGCAYEVENITKVSDRVYKAKVIWIQEETRESQNFEFGIENNNGKCVIDFCNKK